VHDDRELVEKRIRRELWERVLPLVHREERQLSIDAGPDLEHLAPFPPGTEWGAPWETTWFRLRGDIPQEWLGERVEAVVDLGFTRAQAGFQCEGLVADVGSDGRWTPVHGLHPNRMYSRVEPQPGPFELHVEAASNPAFPQFRPSLLGSPDTAGTAPLYRFGNARLVVVDAQAEALAHDIDVLDGIMRSLQTGDPRRIRLLALIASALDAIPDIERARAILRGELVDTGITRRHRIAAVGHAHIDTAWLWPTSETQRKCARTFASAVALMDDDPKFRFACSQAQQYEWIEHRHPELFAAIGERVARGQWVPVGGCGSRPT
jgi:alpha-mannosidase